MLLLKPTVSKLRKSFGIFLSLSLASCQGISFDPDPYVGDPMTSSIVNSEGKRVFCDSAIFGQYAAMHISKWKELREILRRARLPKDEKQILIQKVDFELRLVESLALRGRTALP